MVCRRAAGTSSQLFRPRSIAAHRSTSAGKSVLPACPRLVSLRPSHLCHACDSHRVASDYFWCLFIDPTGDPARLSSSYICVPHRESPARTDLRTPYELDVGGCHARRGGGVWLVRQSC